MVKCNPLLRQKLNFFTKSINSQEYKWVQWTSSKTWKNGGGGDVLKWGEDASWNRNLRLVTAVPYCSLLLFVLGCTIHSFCHACVTSLPGKISGRRGKRSWESERVVSTLSHLILLSDCPGESSPDDCCCLWRLMFL